MKADRIEKLNKIAVENGVVATIKEWRGDFYANINSVSFRVASYKQFEEKCKELENYVKPEPINLTAVLSRIEEMSYFRAKRQGAL